jgi:Zn-dependent protease
VDRKKSYPIFRVFDFSVRLEPSWLILGALVAWSLAVGEFPYMLDSLSEAAYIVLGVAGAIGLFFSIVAHELCHSLVARRYGMHMHGITLFILGGVAEMDDEPPTPRAEFFMAVAGPVSSVAIGVIFLLFSMLLMPVSAPLGVLCSWLGNINLVLAAFNLIPAFPLDGGRMLRAVLWHWRGDMVSATRQSSRVGAFFGVLLMVVALCNVLVGNFIGGIWEGLIGFYLRQAATSSYRYLLLRETLSTFQVASFAERAVLAVPASATLAWFAESWLTRYPSRMFPVVDGERAAGTIGASQLGRVPRERWGYTVVSAVMEPAGDANSISADAAASEAVARMGRDNLSWLMVVERGGAFGGIVTLQRLLDYVAAHLDEPRGMETPPLAPTEQPHVGLHAQQVTPPQPPLQPSHQTPL